MGNYVAGGIVVFNSRTRTVKWQQHLDLSTDRTAFKAYVQASPTLADINGDGKLEVIIGTDMVGLLSLHHTCPALIHLTLHQEIDMNTQSTISCICGPASAVQRKVL